MNVLLLILIGATVYISYKGLNDYNFFSTYKFHVGSIKAGEQFRMLTSGFLHNDIPHLAFNMLTLYFFAPHVISYFGAIPFLVMYLISLVSGSLLALNFHKNEYGYSAVGASGAVTGILYAAILIDPNLPIYLFFIPYRIPTYLFGIGYLLYSLYGMKAKNDNIGHVAHFGGAIGGYAATLLQAPFMLYENTLMVVLLLIPIILLFFLSKNGKL